MERVGNHQKKANEKGGIEGTEQEEPASERTEVFQCTREDDEAAKEKAKQPLQI